MRILSFTIGLSILLLTGCREHGNTSVTVGQIKCNGLENPAGTDSIPVFSWILESVKNDQKVTAWQIIVSSDEKIIRNSSGDAWDSGKIKSAETAWINYGGEPLEQGTQYFWKVRVWDGNDKPSEWSLTGSFITGLFNRKGWSGAKWIGYEDIPDSLLFVPGSEGNGDHLGNVALKRTIIPCFRKEFRTEKKILKALVFISGLGQYELYINGKKTGDSFLSPGWTDYRKTCLYNTYDVTEDLKKGSNAIGAIAGNGFYNINRERYRKFVIAYGAPKMILRLSVKYTDGTEDVIITDGSWKTAPSPVTFSGIYGGEDYDARMEQDGWDEAGFDDSKWEKAIRVKEPSGLLKPEKDFPVTVAEVIPVRKLIVRKDTSFIYDFGQNASGIIKIAVKGKRGQKISFVPGELLGDDSLVTQQATGGPYIFSYILKGEKEEIWMPKFTYYGFRYVQASGAIPDSWPNPDNLPVIADIKLLHTRNSSPEAGTFKCSDELFNSVFTLINWSIKSNLASVATDCPHREKLGWLEQTHLMGNSIKFLYDIHNLYGKIIDDMIEAQLENGLVPDIAPEFVPFVAGFRDSPEWGSACVILPWDMYEWYGDIEAVKKAYPMMKRYLEYLKSMSKGNILSHGLGDWYDLGPKFPGRAQLTPREVTATSIWYYDAKLMAEMALLTGNKEDNKYYATMAEEIRKSFNATFFNPVTNIYSTGSQTAMAMPLFFGMTDDSCKKKVADNLTRIVKENNNSLTAGDIGYRYLLRALEENDQSGLIFDMNSKTDVPGYGYQLSKGATSLTESWAALKYVSNNHMMLGHIMEWFFSGIAGIRQVPGSSSYVNILISPEIVGNIAWAEASYNSVHGTISSSWKTENNIFTLKVKIPVNCKASIALPSTDKKDISVNGLPVSESKEVKKFADKGSRPIIEVGSGEYVFKTPFKVI